MNVLFNYFQVLYLKNIPSNNGYKKSSISILFGDEMVDNPERHNYFRFYKNDEVEYNTLEKLMNEGMDENSELRQLALPLLQNLQIRMKTDLRCFYISQLLDKKESFNAIKECKSFIKLLPMLKYKSYDEMFENRHEFLPIFKGMIKEFLSSKTYQNENYDSLYERIVHLSLLFVCEKIDDSYFYDVFDNDSHLKKYIQMIIMAKYFIDFLIKKVDHYGYYNKIILNLMKCFVYLEQKIKLTGEAVNTFKELCCDDYEQDVVIKSLFSYEDYESFFEKNSLICFHEHVDDERTKVYCKDTSQKFFVKILQSCSNSAFCRNEFIIEFLVSEVIRQKVGFSYYTRNCISLALAIRFDANYLSSEKRLVKNQGKLFPNCLFYENVDGVLFNTYIKKIDRNEAKEIIARIFLVLHELYEQVRFTHYDLHFGNIIITHDLVDGDFIYYIDGKDYVFKNTTGVIPVICDLGRSRVEFEKGKYIGGVFDTLEREFIKVNVEKCYPATDIFKILCLAYACTNDYFYEELLIKFFGWDYEYCKRFKYINFNLYYDEEFKDLRYKDIIPYFCETI